METHIKEQLENDWHDFPDNPKSEDYPPLHIPIEVKTKYGIRKAVHSPYRAFGLTLTDCTHPLQNAHLGWHMLEAWRVINQTNQ